MKEPTTIVFESPLRVCSVEDRKGCYVVEEQGDNYYRAYILWDKLGRRWTVTTHEFI